MVSHIAVLSTKTQKLLRAGIRAFFFIVMLTQGLIAGAMQRKTVIYDEDDESNSNMPRIS